MALTAFSTLMRSSYRPGLAPTADNMRLQSLKTALQGVIDFARSQFAIDDINKLQNALSRLNLEILLSNSVVGQHGIVINRSIELFVFATGYIIYGHTIRYCTNSSL